MSTRVKVPADLAPLVRQCSLDFDAVTAAWMARGWHSMDEVEAMRAAVLAILQGGNGACSDIPDLCCVWREMAQSLVERG